MLHRVPTHPLRRAPKEPQAPGGAVAENVLKHIGTPGLNKLEMKPIDINNNTNNDAITFDKDKNIFITLTRKIMNLLQSNYVI